MPVNMTHHMKYARGGAPVELTPAPVEEAPVEEAPVEETPVEEAPVEEAPVEEAPVEEAPVEEAPEWSMSNTKSELTAAAEAAGVEVRSNWTKAEILAALEA